MKDEIQNIADSLALEIFRMEFDDLLASDREQVYARACMMYSERHQVRADHLRESNEDR